jgi:hypothetical protein
MATEEGYNRIGKKSVKNRHILVEESDKIIHLG